MYYEGVKILYRDYYKTVSYSSTKGQPATYVVTALLLARNMGMPQKLYERVSGIARTGDWIHWIAPLLSTWD